MRWPPSYALLSKGGDNVQVSHFTGSLGTKKSLRHALPATTEAAHEKGFR
jgi:hypothetical protein